MPKTTALIIKCPPNGLSGKVQICVTFLWIGQEVKHGSVVAQVKGADFCDCGDIRDPEGNWLVDSPNFVKPIVRRLELKYRLRNHSNDDTKAER